MPCIDDLHIHSLHSRATSKESTLGGWLLNHPNYYWPDGLDDVALKLV